MATKIPISGFVEFLGQQYKEKAGYILASYGQNPRTGYLDLTETKVKSAWKENGWYYTQYSGKQREKALYWRAHAKRVFDCQGLSEGYYQIATGTCVDTQARYNYANWCQPKGDGTIPPKYRTPGAAVFWGSNASSIHHVGYLYKPVTAGKPDGDWYIIEARGVMYGVVMTRLYERKPNFWGLMTKYFEYTDAVVPQGSAPYFGMRTLKNGCSGFDVKELQMDLIRLGYSCGRWGADGDFGDATEIAVKAFQREHGLEVDGIVGPLTIAKLEEELALLELPDTDPKYVRIEGGNCYVRTAPNTDGAILGVAKNGEEIPYQRQQSDEGWLLVEFKGQNGWVSGKYGRLVK